MSTTVMNAQDLLIRLFRMQEVRAEILLDGEPVPATLDAKIAETQLILDNLRFDRPQIEWLVDSVYPPT